MFQPVGGRGYVVPQVLTTSWAGAHRLGTAEHTLHRVQEKDYRLPVATHVYKGVWRNQDRLTKLAL